jgi:hypothetical protein
LKTTENTHYKHGPQWTDTTELGRKAVVRRLYADDAKGRQLIAVTIVRGTLRLKMVAMRVIPFIFLLLFGTPLQAEEACPKYRVGCISLEHFGCNDVTRDKDIHRVCYNQHARYMIIWLDRRKGVTPYHYCDIGPDVITALKSTVDMYAYYLENIRSKPTGEHGPYDCRDHPVPTTFD